MMRTLKKTTSPNTSLLMLATALAVSVMFTPITVRADHQGTNHHTTDKAAQKSVKLGALTLNMPWSRATTAGAKVGAGYLSISNDGQEDTLLSVTSAISERVEIHEMKMDNNIMRMRELDKGLVIPSKGNVDLKPGGYHIMFMNLKQQIKENETFKAKLTFAKAGMIEVEFNVKSLGGSTEHKH